LRRKRRKTRELRREQRIAAQHSSESK
jgi:hypothetical protein